MKEPAVVHSTFAIEHSYPKPPATVFSAFADNIKKRRWFAEGHNHEVEQYDMDFRIGGAEVARYRLNADTPFPGVVLTNEGSFLDIVPDQLIVIASSMLLGEKRISASLVTFEFLSTKQGTDLVLTHQGAFFEGADGPKMREAGWRTLLAHLANELSR